MILDIYMYICMCMWDRDINDNKFWFMLYSNLGYSNLILGGFLNGAKAWEV